MSIDSKIYKNIAAKLDPYYTEQIRAIAVVKDFAIRKGLIVYGGTAIDFALRLKGSKIYEDDTLAVPDLDFYSPDSIGDAYELTEILYNAGFVGTTARQAVFISTMHVDIGENHYVADFSYYPKKLFVNLPILEYEGMKIIHPDYQRIDIHSSLSFPYDNPPMEVIFHRWKKDITRYELLTQYYEGNFPGVVTPYPRETVTGKLGAISVPKDSLSLVWADIAAYSVIRHRFLEICKKADYKPPDTLVSEFIIGEDSITVSGTAFEIIHTNLAKFGKARRFEKTTNMLPAKAIISCNGYDMVIYDVSDKLVSYVTVDIEGKKLRVAAPQFIMKVALSKALVCDKANAAIYFALYRSLERMIDTVPKLTVGSVSTTDMENLLFPSIKTYGFSNNSDTQKIRLDRTMGTGKYKSPQNYDPSKGIIRSTPAFDYKSLEFFAESGEEINTE
jgi:hypothetical protein